MKKYLNARIVIFFLIPLLSPGRLIAQSAPGQDLTISAEDLRITPGDGGYHLYVRKKPGINSVLLTETTKDPEMQEANYAYRAPDWNSINGSEIRYLNGGILDSEYSRNSIIDSTPEADPEFGQAFHLFIPPTMIYGYPWTRQGSVMVGQGTFVNIRAFRDPYGNYSHGFEDNPYMFDFKTIDVPGPAVEEPLEPTLTNAYGSAAVGSYKEISTFGRGRNYYSTPNGLIDDIGDSLQHLDQTQKADVVFAIDTTGSMKDDMEVLCNDLLPVLIETASGFDQVRYGLVLYRDYVDDYRYQNLPIQVAPFTSDGNTIIQSLKQVVINGTEGGDRPEAVYEALYGAMAFFPWDLDAARKIILVGDAEPHPKPRGSKKYSRELIEEMAAASGTVIDTIILPNGKENE